VLWAGPMLDFADDALACSLSQAVRAVKWNQYGHRLKASTEPASGRGGPGDGGDGGRTLLRSPCWLLKPGRDEAEASPVYRYTPPTPAHPPPPPAAEDEAAAAAAAAAPAVAAALRVRPARLIVVLDVRASALPYANLRKVLEYLVRCGARCCQRRMQIVVSRPESSPTSPHFSLTFLHRGRFETSLLLGRHAAGVVQRSLAGAMKELARQAKPVCPSPPAQWHDCVCC
jgi:hypothetical protein